MVPVLAGMCAGCARYARLDAPLTLPSGEPKTDCERRAWIELIPASVQPAGSGSVYQGLAVYSPGAREPQQLDAILPRMQERDLEESHRDRSRQTVAAARRSLTFSIGGLVVLFGGLGSAVLLQERHHEVANVMGVSSLVVAAIATVAAIVSMPSQQATLDADARDTLFIEGEDDPAAVERGVDRANQSTRQICSGRAPGP